MSEQQAEGQVERVTPAGAPDESLARTASEEIAGQAKAHVREAFSAAYAEVKSLNKEVDLNTKEGMDLLLTKYLGIIENKVEVAFLQVSDWLSEELYHQKQHLVLMQNQVDKGNQLSKKELLELRRLIDQEKAQRTLAQRSAREGKEMLADQMAHVDDRVDVLSVRVGALEVPWWKRCFGKLCMPYNELRNSQYKAIN